VELGLSFGQSAEWPVLRASVLVVVACAACTGLGSCGVACAVGIGENFRGSAVSREQTSAIQDSVRFWRARASQGEPSGQILCTCGPKSGGLALLSELVGPLPSPYLSPEDGGGSNCSDNFRKMVKKCSELQGAPSPFPPPGDRVGNVRKCSEMFGNVWKC
jgi:hypothetical protein